MKRIFASAVVAWMALAPAWADTGPPRYLLRVTQDSALPAVCKTYGLQVVRNIGWLSLYVVSGPANVLPDRLVTKVRADGNVRSFEPDYVTSAAETAAAHPDLKQTTQSLEEALTVDRAVRDFYGVQAWNGYVQQPALSLLELEPARSAGADGAGVVVAVIDSGIDPENALLKGVLLPGYDFTRDQAGASEWSDLVQSTAAILDGQKCDTYEPAGPKDGTVTQSTAAILDGCVPGILTQSTAAILDDETAKLLAEQPPIPASFGHGTMVAGLIHAVAPRARILPLKAFSADGTGRSSDIAEAIYYAVLSGARVLNLSFTFTSLSQEVSDATSYAASQGCTVVAAAGNDGLAAQRWPAEHKWVLGVGATTLWDARATFSNQGYDTFDIGAPGVNLVTTYPGGAYASVSGTSFSTPLVAGAVAIMGTAAPAREWDTMADTVNRGRYAEISDVVRNADRKYPQRILLPPNVAPPPPPPPPPAPRDAVPKIAVK
jgi:subtilisin family serine protease